MVVWPRDLLTSITFPRNIIPNVESTRVRSFSLTFRLTFSSFKLFNTFTQGLPKAKLPHFELPSNLPLYLVFLVKDYPWWVCEKINVWPKECKNATRNTIFGTAAYGQSKYLPQKTKYFTRIISVHPWQIPCLRVSNTYRILD